MRVSAVMVPVSSMLPIMMTLVVPMAGVFVMMPLVKVVAGVVAVFLISVILVGAIKKELNRAAMAIAWSGVISGIQGAALVVYAARAKANDPSYGGSYKR